MSEDTHTTDRQRWRPMPDGYVALASITIMRRPDGSPDFRGFGDERWCTLQLEVQGSNYNRRRMWQRMHIEGPQHLRLETGRMVHAWLSCIEAEPTDLRISRLDGLIVPFKAVIERQSVWKKKSGLFAGDAGGKLINRPLALSADPEHEFYADYMRLARRIGPEQRLADGGELVDVLPGWRLYRDAPAYRLLNKRESRPADERWQKNADRALSRMAALAAHA